MWSVLMHRFSFSNAVPQSLIAVLLAATSLLSLNTVAHADELSGKWFRQDRSAALSFREPGMFELDRLNDGKAEVEGTYLVEGKNVIFRDTSFASDVGNNCQDNYGVYKFTISNGQLSFVPVKESCESRGNLVANFWVK